MCTMHSLHIRYNPDTIPTVINIFIVFKLCISQLYYT